MMFKSKNEKELFRVSQIIAILTLLLFFNVPGLIAGISVFVLGLLTSCGHIQDARPAYAVARIATAIEAVFAFMIAFGGSCVLWNALANGINVMEMFSLTDKVIVFVMFSVMVIVEACKIGLMVECISLAEAIENERNHAEQKDQEIFLSC